MESAIDTYGRHRLLTFDRDPSTREPTVEVAHEALLGAWERLRGWIDEAREDVRMHRRLSDAAREWERSGREPSFLLSGSRLEQFDSWASTTSLALGLGERGYLSASVAQPRDGALRGSGPRVNASERSSAARSSDSGPWSPCSPPPLSWRQRSRRSPSTGTPRRSERRASPSPVSSLRRQRRTSRSIASSPSCSPSRRFGRRREVDGTILPQAEEVLRRAAPAVAIDTSPILGTGIANHRRSRPTEPRSRSSVVMDRSGCGIFGTARGAWRSASPRSRAAPMLDVPTSSMSI